ncbi:RNA polymerase sigma factor [Pseudopedobacter beijingensis]|uniref:RNA polymerase sigma factor n=1 Tax=Pseudopedobacter beijingensis TaxID=1207056 RepID=A0ABW4I7P3_9SPHI
MQTVTNFISIENLRKGDQQAFEHVYKNYGAQVYRLAFRFLKDKAQSEEIVQETFIKLWLNREKLDINGNLWLYLYVIAKRLSLNELRKISQSEELSAQLLLNITDAHNGTEEEVLAADMEKFTESVLNKLPNQQQTIFRLSRVEGLTHQQIAEKLGISPNTVKNHMVEALKNIKNQLKDTELVYFITLLFLFDQL